MAAKIEDVRRTTSDFKAAGDVIYLLGATYNELGGSELYRLFGELGANVPVVRQKEAKALYLKVMEANQRRLIESSHDLSDGGLAVAVAECAFGSDFGADINLTPLCRRLSVPAALFSESHSRFLVTARPELQADFESLFGGMATRLGYVTTETNVNIVNGSQRFINLPVKTLLEAWKNGLIW